jgi:hypothetical protein
MFGPSTPDTDPLPSFHNLWITLWMMFFQEA